MNSDGILRDNQLAVMTVTELRYSCHLRAFAFSRRDEAIRLLTTIWPDV